MKRNIISLLLALLLLSGCGTSQPVSSLEESTFGSEEWADLMTPTPEPSPIPDRETPPPEEETEDDLGEEVTDDYKHLFLGTWDNDNGSMIYEFKANENLIITSSSGTESTFTIAGSNITLYDVLSGSAVEVLHRRAEVSPEPSVVPTVAPSASPSPTPVPTPTPVPSQAPTAEPSPIPSEVPEAVTDPSQEPTEEPTEDPTDRPPVVDDGTVDVELPNVAMEAMAAIECVMDVMGSGESFDPTSPDFFWKVMARYISRMEGEGLSEGDTMTVTAENVESYAKQVFADFSTLPALPSDTALVSHGDGSYLIRFGEGGSMLDVQGYNEEKGALVAGYNGTVYDISINGVSAITDVSVNEDPALP